VTLTNSETGTGNGASAGGGAQGGYGWGGGSSAISGTSRTLTNYGTIYGST
jgi:hypothetical protein